MHYAQCNESTRQAMHIFNVSEFCKVRYDKLSTTKHTLLGLKCEAMAILLIRMIETKKLCIIPLSVYGNDSANESLNKLGKKCSKQLWIA